MKISLGDWNDCCFEIQLFPFLLYIERRNGFGLLFHRTSSDTDIPFLSYNEDREQTDGYRYGYYRRGGGWEFLMDVPTKKGKEEYKKFLKDRAVNKGSFRGWRSKKAYPEEYPA